MRRPWTREEDARLKAMLGEGKTSVEVGDALGRSSRAVEERARSRGPVRYERRGTPDFWTDARLEALREGVRKGMSYLQLAGLVGGGCTRNQAMGKAMRLGIAKDKAPAKHILPQRAKAPRKPRPSRARAQTPKPIAPLPPPEAIVIVTPASGVKPGRLPPASAFAPLEGVEPVTLLARRSTACAWPVGDRLCCGLRVMDGKSYCPDHFTLSIAAVQPKRGSLARSVRGFK